MEGDGSGGPGWLERARADQDIMRDLQVHHQKWMSEHADNMREIVLAHETRVCRRVQELREERGWSQAELARRLAGIGFDMHQTTVAKLEAGKRPLRVAELVALSSVFGLPPVALFYLPIKTESLSMEYLRERLERIDAVIQDGQEKALDATETFNGLVAEKMAERLQVVEEMRRASLNFANEGVGNGEHSEAP